MHPWPSMRLLLLVLVALLSVNDPMLSSVARQATPAAERAITADTIVTSEFPRGLQVDAVIAIDSVPDLSDVTLLYRPVGRETFTAGFVDTIETLDQGSIRVSTFLDFQVDFMPSGLVLEYRWQIDQASGPAAVSAMATMDWFDERFDWQIISSEQVEVRFYDQDPAFAEQILASGQSTVDSLEQRFDLEQTPPLRIWVYTSSDDFAGSVQANSRDSIAGVSYPGFSGIAAVIPAGSNGEIGRVVPHEISHQVLFEATRNPFTTVPIWFDEGIATNVQLGGTDGYPDMVRDALERDALFELSSLDASFPFQPAQATLAYASSYSVVQFIEEQWGDAGIARLVDAFGEGISTDDALVRALGITLADLDDAWKSWIAGSAWSAESAFTA